MCAEVLRHIEMLFYLYTQTTDACYPASPAKYLQISAELAASKSQQKVHSIP
jgi:hypothetical protein